MNRDIQLWLIIQRVAPFFVIGMVVGGCSISTTRDLAHDRWIEVQRRECDSPQGVCLAELLAGLPIDTLKRKGSEIRIDCGLDFVDYSEESARVECEKNVLSAMDELVNRWSDQLLPVGRTELRFDLSDEGCISLTNGYCACTFSGSARVPLVWKPPLYGNPKHAENLPIDL